MKTDKIDRLLEFLQYLENQGISYTLGHHREEAIMVTVAVPGERWEVEFLRDGSVEVEKFISNGDIAGEEALNEFFSRHTDEKTITSKSPANIDLAGVSQ